ARAFGWHTIVIDGQDVNAINAAYQEALGVTGKPTCIVAKTEKGAGVSFLANKEGWHGKALKPDEAEKALAELGNPPCKLTVQPQLPPEGTSAVPTATGRYEPPTYEVGALVATREAYGDALKAVGAADPHVVALDGEVSNSTFSDRFQKAFPERFFEI